MKLSNVLFLCLFAIVSAVSAIPLSVAADLAEHEREHSVLIEGLQHVQLQNLCLRNTTDTTATLEVITEKTVRLAANERVTVDGIRYVNFKGRSFDVKTEETDTVTLLPGAEHAVNLDGLTVIKDVKKAGCTVGWLNWHVEAELIVSSLDAVANRHPQHCLGLTDPDVSLIMNDNLRIAKTYYPQVLQIAEMNEHGTCGLPRNEALEKKQKISVHSCRAFLFPVRINRIQHHHHRTWVTNNGTECPEDLLMHFINSVKTFDEHKFEKKWEHHFWCLDKQKIPHTIEFLTRHNPSIKIHEIEKEIPQMRTRSAIQKLIDANFYTISKNLISFEIINAFGGVHFDMGFHVKKDMTHFIDCYDYLFYYHSNETRHGNFPDLTFFAAPAQSKIISTFLSIFENLHRASDAVKALFTGGWNTMHYVGVGVLHPLIDSEVDEQTKILYLRESSYFDANRQGSWCGFCKFGNKNIYDYADFKCFDEAMPKRSVV